MLFISDWMSHAHFSDIVLNLILFELQIIFNISLFKKF